MSGRVRSDRVSAAAASIPAGGADKYIQNAFQLPEAAADAKLRAGFMPNPDNGASKQTYRKTKVPTKTPVKRDRLEDPPVTNTTSINKNEIANSAAAMAKNAPAKFSCTCKS